MLANDTAVIIPALNEAGNIGDLVRETWTQPVKWVIVVDNGSTDGTSRLAREAGAMVIEELRRGYGYACQAGTAAALSQKAHILVYMDGDYSSLPGELSHLLAPLYQGEADLVLGSRALGHIDAKAMPLHQRFGNWLAARLLNRLYGVRLTDLGPYRAIRAEWMRKLVMTEMTFGWPTEMMVKVAKKEGRLIEVPVSWHKRRSGRSKIGGTLFGSLLAGYRILSTILRHAYN